MPKKKKYIPRDQDKKWLEMVIHITKDGGTWGWPDAQISYQFNIRYFILVFFNYIDFLSIKQ